MRIFYNCTNLNVNESLLHSVNPGFTANALEGIIRKVGAFSRITQYIPLPENLFPLTGNGGKRLFISDRSKPLVLQAKCHLWRVLAEEKKRQTVRKCVNE